MIIYLSGRIRGNPGYKKQFAAAEERILAGNARRRVRIEVINPAKITYPETMPNGKEKEEAIMKICKGFLDMSDAIYLLSGWEESKGAKEELLYFLQQHSWNAEVYVEGGTGLKYGVLEGLEV